MLEPATKPLYSTLDTVTGFLSHRAPFLFVDQAEVDDDLSTARGIYRFSEKDWFFPGHFPDDPIVPGVILLEMAAQTANVLLSLRAGCSTRAYLISADNVGFKAPVRALETVVADVRLTRDPAPDAWTEPGHFFSFRTSIRRDETQCMRADLTIWWAR